MNEYLINLEVVWFLHAQKYSDFYKRCKDHENRNNEFFYLEVAIQDRFSHFINQSIDGLP